MPSRHQPSEPAAEPSVCDVTLLDYLRALSPEERLRLNDRAVAAARELRRAFAAGEPDLDGTFPRTSGY